MPEEADAGAPALLEEREAGEHVAALQQEVAQLRLQLAVRRSASRRNQLHVLVKNSRACGACAQQHSRFLSRVTSFLPRTATLFSRVLKYSLYLRGRCIP